MKKLFKKHRTKISILVFIAGIAVLLYPLLSQIYYDVAIESELETFKKEIENFKPIELKNEKVELAKAFNEALEPQLFWEDPFSDEKRHEGVKAYAKMLEVREKIGLINIPKIEVMLPVYAGTSEKILQKGAGHLEGTSLPVGGENTHSVITAHSGLPSARLFTDLEKLEIDDIFSVETLAGELFYKVEDIKVIEPDDTDSIHVVKGKDYMTLLTCTPYMINSHRLLVRGERFEMPEELVEEQDRNFTEKLLYYLNLYKFYFALIGLTLFIVAFIVRRKRN